MRTGEEDPGPRGAADRERGVPDAEPRLLCVAMMRGGPKRSSFEVLADALARLGGERWHLTVAGDGPARREVEALLASRLSAGRVTFVGRVEGDALAALYAGSDLFVWPAIGEAMGMAMLEAQGHGLPVVAGRIRGVPEIVRTARPDRSSARAMRRRSRTRSGRSCERPTGAAGWARRLGPGSPASTASRWLRTGSGRSWSA